MIKKINIEMTVEDHYDEAALRRVMNADAAYASLREIADQIFRPARKHGYSEKNLNDMLEGEENKADELIGELETKFYDILRENNISLDDYS